MQYYLVAPGTLRFHGSEPLTYSSDKKLPVGNVVKIPLGQSHVLGVVVATTSKPSFETKPIVHAYDNVTVPTPLLATWRWMQAYYPSPLGAVTQLLLPAAAPQQAVPQLPVASVHTAYFTDMPLTDAQQAALQQIQPTGTHILHGDTGSGKTRLYIELCRQALESGRSSIVLTPEISLTSQLLHNLQLAFGDAVIVIHSQLTATKRRDIWLSVANTKTPVIVVGPRSALFLPVKNIGLIVLDESHDHSYKQESSPYYHATRLAGVLGAAHKAQVILGSATPAIGDYFLASQKKAPIIRLTGTARADAGSVVSVVDMKQSRKDGLLSTDLLTAIRSTLQRGEQTLLFINRRGTARLVLCSQCGWEALCPRCDIPLTYHADDFELRCHTCGYQDNVPTACPSCRQSDILMRSAGTKALVGQIAKLFPGAQIARFDTDNKRGERFHERYEDIKSGKADIIIGTQLLAKGLDLPNLTLVGIVQADTSLYLPDFSAGERTYQVIHQLIGRVGRGHKAGQVIVQTYLPEHPVMMAASQQNWQAFYAQELSERSQFSFPPFVSLLKITMRRATQNGIAAYAAKVHAQLVDAALPVTINDPTPALKEKIRDKYEWQIVVRGTSRRHLLQIIELLPRDCSYDIDPVDLL